MLFYVLYLFTSISVVSYLFFKWKFSYWKSREVPTLPPLIPYGNFKGVYRTKHMRHLLDEVYSTFKNKSPVAGSYYLFNPIAIILDLDLAKDVLIRNFNHFHDRPLYQNEEDDPVSATILSLRGERWKRIRQKLTPTFSSAKMKFMFPTIVDVSNRFANILSDEIQSEAELEVKDFLARYTTDVIGTCALGVECNSLKDPHNEFRRYGYLVINEPRHSFFVRTLIRQFPNLAKRLHVKLARDDVSEFILKVVRETVKFREKNDVRKNDFMDLLIEMKNKDSDGLGRLTIEEIAAQAYLFFIAGYETTSTALAYTLYELALNHEVQDKGRGEILRVLQKHGGKFTYEAVMDMKYLGQLVAGMGIFK